MENITIDTKLKKVGNSLAFFIPAEVRDELGLGPDDEIVAQIHKKKEKNVKEILSMFGALKGSKITWSCKEDRLNEWRE